jgi:hypothetical protein
MTLYLSNRDGNGKTNEEGHYKFSTNAFTGNVLTATDLVVSQQSPLALGVNVAPGTYRIPDLTGSYAYTGWNNAATNVTISTADPANPRISAIVIYIDKAASTSASPPNNPGVAKFLSVNGTPAASPTAPNSTAIQAAVGAGNPYIVLANARVNAAATTVTNALITDVRVLVTVASNLVNTASLQDNAVGTAEIAPAAVTTAKVADLAATTQKMRPTTLLIAGNNGASRQLFPAANTTYVVAGLSTTYTSGPTNEVLEISANGLYNPQTSTGTMFFVAVNGTPVSKAHYLSIASNYTTVHSHGLYNIPANTTVTIDARIRTAAANAGAEICNSAGDQSNSPSYGTEMRIVAWGRT